jgi:transposase
MSLRSLNREQTWLLPPSLDELIPCNHPSRYIATFVDTQERVWAEMGIAVEGEIMGAPAYHPRALLSVWLYGFMTGTRSSRKLEAACRDQLPYLWLTAWQHPDHNTLWRFYQKNRKSFKHLFKRTVSTAINLGLVDMAIQAVDGTKILGNASKNRTYDKGALKKLLDRTESAIADLEAQNENETDPPPVYLPEKLTEKQKLKEAIKSAMEQISDEEVNSPVNLTDKDTKLMKSRQGIVPAYNLQAAAANTADGKSFVLVAEDVVQDQGDKAQLSPIAAQAEDNTGRKPDILLADAGYHSGKNLEFCADKGQAIAMPEAPKTLSQPYHKDNFIYSRETDSYLCPQGQVLKLSSKGTTRNKRKYRASATICKKCPAFGECTKNGRQGRTIEIGPHEAVLRQHREWMKSKEAKDVFRKRKTIIEPVFGILKEQQGARRFLLRGLENVKAEASLLATAFNLRTLYQAWQASSTPNLPPKLIKTAINFLYTLRNTFTPPAKPSLQY